jgi:hypothetical protein
MITTVEKLIKELSRYDGKLKVRVWNVRKSLGWGTAKIKSVGETPVDGKPVVTINFEE